MIWMCLIKLIMVNCEKIEKVNSLSVPYNLDS
jgi:hypothetical protein